MENTSYQVLDVYPLDIAITQEELEAVAEDMRLRHGPVMETGNITTCITTDSIIYVLDPDGEFARSLMGRGPWRSVRDKVDGKDLYGSLSKCTTGFFLPVVFRRKGSCLVDAHVMLRCLTNALQIA